jgi:hypothetical protein
MPEFSHYPGRYSGIDPHIAAILYARAREHSGYDRYMAAASLGGYDDFTPQNDHVPSDTYRFGGSDGDDHHSQFARPRSEPPPDRSLIQAQDKDFESASRDQHEMEARRQAAEETARLTKTLDREAIQEYIAAAFESLGPEPEDGVKVVAELPGRKRIARKFNISDPGEVLFLWIQHEEEMMVNGELIEFSLSNATMPVDRAKTLEEQKIVRQTLVRVIC